MGNCCVHESTSSPTMWAGDDWESLLATGTEEEEREALLRGDTATLCGSASSHGRRERVKIKITKKELQELVKKVDMRKLSPQDVVESLLIDASAGGSSHRCSAEKHHQPWRPALKSIPEVN
ncbi:uncharacterized protein LOC115742884 [Rhodamnia argentea]|uniref:Uncharacterized protein LOC115742884 n=1 Tax=Rhodamnia argentea TaxID=178133 RepID=A0A8B8PEN2_9MYRT|nr:uncharacterized protein LOC115742884 [Rhodamnia argentea]